jgi:hypothetical protein
MTSDEKATIREIISQELNAPEFMPGNLRLVKMRSARERLLILIRDSAIKTVPVPTTVRLAPPLVGQVYESRRRVGAGVEILDVCTDQKSANYQRAFVRDLSPSAKNRRRWVKFSTLLEHYSLKKSAVEGRYDLARFGMEDTNHDCERSSV